jgi:rare lipoprotein A (peptidoglycan hydrolase)
MNIKKKIIGFLAIFLLFSTGLLTASSLKDNRSIENELFSSSDIIVKEEKKQNCSVGLASYYQRCFGTCDTAYGEWFEPDGISVAHKTLPHNTNLLVTNLHNGRTLKVRVNDKGPYVKGRVLDFSRGAMRKLGGLNSGVIRVEYCILN